MKCDGGPNNVLRPRNQSNQYWEIDKKKLGLRPWALCFDPQLVRRCVGGAMWPIDCSNIKTRKSQNLIYKGWDGGNHEARVKAFLVLRASWHT